MSFLCNFIKTSFALLCMRGDPKKLNLFIKNCVFILTYLNFCHLQSTLHLTQYTYQYDFFTARNSFWTRWFWCLLVLLLFFLSPLPHQQNVSLWGLFSSGETNKQKRVVQGEIGWIGRVGYGVMLFWVKNCWTLCRVWAGVPVNHPSWNGQTLWKSSKKPHWSWTQPLTTTPAGTLIQMGS